MTAGRLPLEDRAGEVHAGGARGPLLAPCTRLRATAPPLRIGTSLLNRRGKKDKRSVKPGAIVKKREETQSERLPTEPDKQGAPPAAAGAGAEDPRAQDAGDPHGVRLPAARRLHFSPNFSRNFAGAGTAGDPIHFPEVSVFCRTFARENLLHVVIF